MTLPNLYNLSIKFFQRIQGILTSQFLGMIDARSNKFKDAKKPGNLYLRFVFKKGELQFKYLLNYNY